MDVSRLLTTPLRRPARFLIPIIVAGLAAAWLGRLWPPRYQATAVLRVQRADPGVSIERTILDPERLQKLVQELDAAAGTTGAPWSERLYQLHDNLAVHARGPDTYAVEYADHDLHRAADVVQRLTLLLTRDRSVAASAPPASHPLAAQLAQAKRELEAKEASHGKTRRTEQELLASSRELLVLQKRYLALLNQKMSDRLATAVEAPSQSVSFRIDVPARLPERPVSPGAGRLSWGVLALGVLVGWVFSLRGAPRSPTPQTTRSLEEETPEFPPALAPTVDTAVTVPAPASLDPAETETAAPEPEGIAEEPPETLVIPAGLTSAAAASAPDDLLEPGSVFLRAPRPARTSASESQPTPALPEAPAQSESEALLEPGSVFLRTPRPARTSASESQPTPALPEAPAQGESEAFVEPGSVLWKTLPTTATQPIPILAPIQVRAEEEAALAVEQAAEVATTLLEKPAPEEVEPAATLEIEGISEPPQPAVTASLAVPQEAAPAATPEIEGIAEPPQPAVTASLAAPQEAAQMDGGSVPGLVVSGGPAHGSVLVLTSAPVERLVGAAAYCHLRVDLPNVAPVHVRVAWDGFGLNLVDAGSSTGTYVNGHRIAGRYPLREGDHVSLGPPGSSQSVRLLVYLPPLSERAPAMMAAAHATFEAAGRAAAAHPPPAPPAPTPPAASAAAFPSPTPPILEPGPPFASTATPSRPAGRWLPAAAAIAILAAGAFVGRRLVEGSAPVLVEVAPARARLGQTILLGGSGFDRAPDKNTVRLGEQTAFVVSAREDRLEIVVPRELPFALPAAVSVSVEVAGRRSAPSSLSVVAAPRVARLEPPVARRGDVVTALGEHLAGEHVTVLVAGLAAEVVDAQPGSLRFRVPVVASTQEGARLSVDVWAAGEQAERAFLVVGHLPAVSELAPRRGSVGERVTLRGYGFDPDPGGNRVRFGEQEALVLSAAATELIVSAPARGALLAAQTELAVTVQALGATSTPAAFTVLAPSGMFVPHFYAAPVPELPARNHAFVSSELGPVMLLTGPAGSSSTAERAAGVARVLNSLVEEAAKPLALTFAVEPDPSVALAGGHTVVATATPRDALGYEGLWAELGKPGQATPHSVATHWTALLQDYLTLFVEHERPTHVLALSPRGQLLVDIYSEAVKAAGAAKGVPTEVLGRLRPGAAESLREMALLLPAPGQSNPGAVVVGRWQGTMEEGEKGAQPIQVRLFFEGRKLAGSLTRKSPRGVAAETRLRDVSYDGAALAFALPAGSSLLQFKASVREDAMAGVIRAGPQAGRALGFFTLSYAE